MEVAGSAINWRLKPKVMACVPKAVVIGSQCSQLELGKARAELAATKQQLTALQA